MVYIKNTNILIELQFPPEIRSNVEIVAAAQPVEAAAMVFLGQIERHHGLDVPRLNAEFREAVTLADTVGL